MKKLPLRPYLLFFFSTLVSLSVATDTLTPTQPLSDGETLISANGTFALGFFTPAINSKNRYVGIWYNKISIQTVVWVANRKNPIVDSTGNLRITVNGTLIITGNNSTAVWSSAATTASNPIAQILDSGNFVVKEANNDNLEIFPWQSFDHPTDTLLPGMKLGWNLTSGLQRNLTAWASQTDPSPGPYSLAMDVRGDPQIFLWAGLTRKWRTGPWNGLRLSGVPEMKSYSIFTVDFVQTSEEVYCTFGIRNPSIISRLTANQTGLIERFVWLDQSKAWNLFWFAPKDQCDDLSPCGPFGVCNPSDLSICECLQGFKPKSPANWALRDGSGGCVRRTQLDCRHGTDGFVTVSEAKLPDTSSSTVDMSLSLDECRAKCLGNCSCTAYASANIVNETGCILWTTELTDLRVWTFGGQDLYVRLAAADLGSTSDPSHTSRVVTIAIIVPIVLGSVLLAWIGCCIWRKKKRRAVSGTSSTYLYNYDDTEATDYEQLPLFDLGAIVAATDNFSGENKLGEGGFGPVFKGTLGDGHEIAVKRLSKTSGQGVDEFKNEIMLIAKLQHRNLVRLLGCCIHGEDRMLIYEYMPNKSLDAFLFDKAKCTLLDWKTRYNIIMGIARGLLYLHQDSRFRIIHRDLKASNVLLDKQMNPKISDFGTARIFGEDETEVNTRKVVGTYGYMSPEYVIDGIFSVKSDVFSFGVLVLEIISGKKNRRVYLTEPDVNLLEHAWRLWKEGNGLELVDESMGCSFTRTEALRCINVGLLCVQERPEDRPTMPFVMLMLGSETVTLPPPKRPGFVTTRGAFEHDPSTSKQELFTVNNLSDTMFEGR